MLPYDSHAELTEEPRETKIGKAKKPATGQTSEVRALSSYLIEKTTILIGSEIKADSPKSSSSAAQVKAREHFFCDNHGDDSKPLPSKNHSSKMTLGNEN